MTYKSILYWPKEVSLFSTDNSSTDTHHDEVCAVSVCMTLIRKGLGCDYKHFPVKAIAKSDDEIIFEWTKEDGVITEKIDLYKSKFPRLY